MIRCVVENVMMTIIMVISMTINCVLKFYYTIQTGIAINALKSLVYRPSSICGHLKHVPIVYLYLYLYNYYYEFFTNDRSKIEKKNQQQQPRCKLRAFE